MLTLREVRKSMAVSLSKGAVGLHAKGEIVGKDIDGSEDGRRIHQGFRTMENGARLATFRHD